MNEENQSTFVHRQMSGAAAVKDFSIQEDMFSTLMHHHGSFSLWQRRRDDHRMDRPSAHSVVM